jgi:hypothetical protein
VALIYPGHALARRLVGALFVASGERPLVMAPGRWRSAAHHA